MTEAIIPVITAIIGPLLAGGLTFVIVKWQNGKSMSKTVNQLSTKMDGMHTTLTTVANDTKQMREGECPTAKRLEKLIDKQSERIDKLT